MPKSSMKPRRRSVLESDRATTVEVEVLGHLIFYLPAESRRGTKATVPVPSGTAVGHLPEMLGIPKHEIQSVLVNGATITNPATALGPSDRVAILPVISGG